MWKDEIIEGIHRIREIHAKAFNDDLRAMFAYWQRKQDLSGHKVVTLPPKIKSK